MPIVKTVCHCFQTCSCFLGEEEVSELGDVIRFLTKTAEEKTGRFDNTSGSYGNSLQPSSEIQSLPTAPPKVSKSASIPEKQSAAPPIPPSQSKVKSESASVRVDGYGRGHGRGRVSHTKPQSTKPENDGNQSNSDDDDDNWRKTRNRIKQNTEPVLNLNTSEQDSQQSFWNVYGMPTTALKTSPVQALGSGKYEPKPILSPSNSSVSGDYFLFDHSYLFFSRE